MLIFCVGKTKSSFPWSESCVLLIAPIMYSLVFLVKLNDSFNLFPSISLIRPPQLIICLNRQLKEKLLLWICRYTFPRCGHHHHAPTLVWFQWLWLSHNEIYKSIVQFMTENAFFWFIINLHPVHAGRWGWMVVYGYQGWLTPSKLVGSVCDMVLRGREMLSENMNKFSATAFLPSLPRSNASNSTIVNVIKRWSQPARQASALPRQQVIESVPLSLARIPSAGWCFRHSLSFVMQQVTCVYKFIMYWRAGTISYPSIPRLHLSK